MNEFICFYFEGMSLNLSESTWIHSGSQIPDWTVHFLTDVLAEGFTVVGIFGNKMNVMEDLVQASE
jgi:hypothetical protein